MQDLLNLVELQDSARQVLGRARERGAPEADLWGTLIELGWLGVCLPAENGGLGQPFAALATLYQELGRVLAPHDFVGVSICLSALAGVAGDGCVARETIAQTLAGAARPMCTGTLPREIKAVDGRLRGVIRGVLDVGAASHLLVPFEAAGPVLALLKIPHPGLSIVRRPTWDLTRRLFDVVAEDAAVEPRDVVFEGAAATAVMKMTEAQLNLALACDAVGGSEAIFGETLLYMQSRHQFGRPIASFQALKHRCADLATEMSASGALLIAGCDALSMLQGDWESRAACSRLYAGEVYRRVTEEAIQLHGGIGFTWEHQCHRYLKRARLNEVLGGTPEQRKDALAPALFRGAASNAAV
ncbi:MAG: acyl-CoA dehydrogenase family protein [Gammaproteobacteria bacterium]